MLRLGTQGVVEGSKLSLTLKERHRSAERRQRCSGSVLIEEAMDLLHTP